MHHEIEKEKGVAVGFPCIHSEISWSLNNRLVLNNNKKKLRLSNILKLNHWLVFKCCNPFQQNFSHIYMVNTYFSTHYNKSLILIFMIQCWLLVYPIWIKVSLHNFFSGNVKASIEIKYNWKNAKQYIDKQTDTLFLLMSIT